MNSNKHEYLYMLHLYNIPIWISIAFTQDTGTKRLLWISLCSNVFNQKCPQKELNNIVLSGAGVYLGPPGFLWF